MPKIQYKEINFRGKSLELINLVNQVVEEYQAQGYELTLRQAYYQLVARGYIPNNERSYKNIGSLINDGRLAGLIDWYSITDRTRNLRSNGHWDNPADVIGSARYSYMLDESECGQLWWGSLSDRRKEIIKAIPNFDAEIFFQCTGVRVDE